MLFYESLVDSYFVPCRVFFIGTAVFIETMFRLQSLVPSFAAYSTRSLPKYQLPKQARKTSLLQKSLKMKFFRLKRDKTQARPKAPNYGRDDFRCLSKMNI
jgi:hypothetical protein